MNSYRPSQNLDAAHGASPREANDVREEALERRLDAERVRERPVLGPEPVAVPRGTRRPGGAEEDVLRGVLERDELDDLDLVAGQLEQPRAGSVGHLGREPLAQRAVPQQRPERVVRELAQELVLAARHREDHVGAGPNRAIERDVGGGVARAG